MELRPVGGCDALDRVGAIGGVRDAGATAVRLDELVDRAQDADHELRETGEVAEALLVDEDRVVSVRQGVAARAGVGRRVVDVEEAGHGLLLEPFAHIALRGTGPRCEVGRCRSAALSQRAVEAEPSAHVDRRDLQRVDRRIEQAVDERVGRGH